MEDKIKFLKFVAKYKKQFECFHEKNRIVIISSTNSETGNNECSLDITMDLVITLCQNFNIEYDFFLDENKFIEKILLNGYSNKKNTFIFNRAFRGSFNSRRILIPAFCGYNNLPFLGNDAYRMGLLCDKFHYYSILKYMGIPVADFYYYHYKFGWATKKPPNGLKVIMKLSNENNKVSITDNSVFNYSYEYESPIHALSKKHSQGVVIQKFISGYEVTVPILVDDQDIIIPNVLGVKYETKLKQGHSFLSEDYFVKNSSCESKDKYYDFDMVNPQISEEIRKYSKTVMHVLGINSFTRLDLRVDESWDFYFNDVGSMPAILPTGTFPFIYSQNNLTFDDFLISIICSDLKL